MVPRSNPIWRAVTLRQVADVPAQHVVQVVLPRWLSSGFWPRPRLTFSTFQPIALSPDSRIAANDHVGTVTQASRATATKMAAINVPNTLVIAPSSVLLYFEWIASKMPRAPGRATP